MMPAPTALSSPLVSPMNSLSLHCSTWSALPTYGAFIPSGSLVPAGSSRVGCPCTPSDCPELMTLVPSNVVVAANSLLIRVSSALTASNSVALDAPCSSNVPMVALVSFSLVRAATCSRSYTPSAHSLASSTWDKPSASLSSATLFINSLIESTAASFSHAS